MRYLGIDYGLKRIGIAVSDPEGRIAFPKKLIFNRGSDYVLSQLKSLLDEDKASAVIVGLPLGLDGGETEESVRVRAFAERLKKKIAQSVYLENEILTTHLVKSLGVKKEHTDEAAAAVILQSYLDKVNKG